MGLKWLLSIVGERMYFICQFFQGGNSLRASEKYHRRGERVFRKNISEYCLLGFWFYCLKVIISLVAGSVKKALYLTVIFLVLPGRCWNEGRKGRGGGPLGLFTKSLFADEGRQEVPRTSMPVDRESFQRRERPARLPEACSRGWVLDMRFTSCSLFFIRSFCFRSNPRFY